MEAAAETNGTATIKSGIPANIPAVEQPLAGEASEIASNINYHAQFSPHFSPFKFEPEQAYYAAADSVRDRLIRVWITFYLYLGIYFLKKKVLAFIELNVSIFDAVKLFDWQISFSMIYCMYEIYVEVRKYFLLCLWYFCDLILEFMLKVGLIDASACLANIKG